MKQFNYFNEEFSEFIKDIIQQSGLTYEQLAVITNLNIENIKRYANGTELIPSNDFSLIVDATNTSKNKVINFLHDLYVFGATNNLASDEEEIA